MNKENKDFFGYVAIYFVIFCLGFAIVAFHKSQIMKSENEGYQKGVKAMQIEAIMLNHAHWEAKDDGEVVFKWNSNEYIDRVIERLKSK